MKPGACKLRVNLRQRIQPPPTTMFCIHVVPDLGYDAMNTSEARVGKLCERGERCQLGWSGKGWVSNKNPQTKSTHLARVQGFLGRDGQPRPECFHGGERRGPGGCEGTRPTLVPPPQWWLCWEKRWGRRWINIESGAKSWFCDEWYRYGHSNVGEGREKRKNASICESAPSYGRYGRGGGVAPPGAQDGLHGVEARAAQENPRAQSQATRADDADNLHSRRRVLSRAG
jgi:hypothetical protein